MPQLDPQLLQLSGTSVLPNPPLWIHLYASDVLCLKLTLPCPLLAFIKVFSPFHDTNLNHHYKGLCQTLPPPNPTPAVPLNFQSSISAC